MFREQTLAERERQGSQFNEQGRQTERNIIGQLICFYPPYNDMRASVKEPDH